MRTAFVAIPHVRERVAHVRLRKRAVARMERVDSLLTTRIQTMNVSMGSVAAPGPANITTASPAPARQDVCPGIASMGFVVEPRVRKRVARVRPRKRAVEPMAFAATLLRRPIPTMNAHWAIVMVPAFARRPWAFQTAAFAAQIRNALQIIASMASVVTRHVPKRVLPATSRVTKERVTKCPGDKTIPWVHRRVMASAMVMALVLPTLVMLVRQEANV